MEVSAFFINVETWIFHLKAANTDPLTTVHRKKQTLKEVTTCSLKCARESSLKAKHKHFCLLLFSHI